jgi:hypothetical protein
MRAWLLHLPVAGAAGGKCFSSCDAAKATCGHVISCDDDAGFYCGSCPTTQLCTSPDKLSAQNTRCTDDRAADECDHIELVALTDERMESYRGCQQRTVTGRTCQAWSSQAPHAHNFGPENYVGKGLAANFCRNPVAHTTIWCLTMDPEKRWEECHPIGSEHEEKRSPFEALREKEEKQALARARADEAARLKAERVAAVAQASFFPPDTLALYLFLSRALPWRERSTKLAN